MKNHKKNPVSEFIKDIWIALPLHRKQEKRFIGEIEENVSDYFDSNPDATKQELVLQFGEPKEIVDDYFHALEPGTYIESMRRTRYIKHASYAFMLFLGVLLSTFIFFSYQLYNEWHDSQAVGKTITIEYLY
ncbi:MAG: DUF6120 family protein [Lachnospiraceae bacterium]|nr:DUF6120 family protein [Lachnospiraceae bacterium]